jgi:hypothetical protein
VKVRCPDRAAGLGARHDIDSAAPEVSATFDADRLVASKQYGSSPRHRHAMARCPHRAGGPYEKLEHGHKS